MISLIAFVRAFKMAKALCITNLVAVVGYIIITKLSQLKDPTDSHRPLTEGNSTKKGRPVWEYALTDRTFPC